MCVACAINRFPESGSKPYISHIIAYRRQQVPDMISILLMIIICLYVAVRVCAISITADEANTCNWHIQAGWIDIITFRSPGLPDNNHVLNTVLCKLSVMLFGLPDFTLRLPSLLGCLLFVVGLHRSPG